MYEFCVIKKYKELKKKKLPFYENVLITDVAAEGVALARVNELVVFVPNVIPGDRVDIQVVKKKKNFQEGIAVTIHEYSTDRVKPFCEHYGVCGGCKWQILPYSKQLFYKQKQVTDVFQRIGKLQFSEISPILGSATLNIFIPSGITVLIFSKISLSFMSLSILISIVSHRLSIPSESGRAKVI